MTNAQSNRNRGVANPQQHVRPELRAALSLMAFGLIVWPSALFAGATIDSSWGRTPRALSGNFVIPEANGKLAGTNLFHSFQKFDVNANESATFTTSTPTLLNVISRVTGNAASSINGPLSLRAAEGSAPNFFFINPSGVTFGPGAQINVPASFHVSTSKNLRFSDGTVFKAGAGPDRTLTVAAPEAFGFLGRNGKVVFNGVVADGTAGHAANTAALVDVSAAEIHIENSRISIPGAEVRLIATGTQANSVPVNDAPSIGKDGRIALTNSTLDASRLSGFPRFPNPGAIALNGSKVQIDNSELISSKFSGRGGAISIDANVVTILGQSRLTANSGSIAAGSIAIRATGDVLVVPKPGSTAGSFFTIAKFGENPGQIGEISIAGGSVRLVNAGINTSNPDDASRPISIISQSSLSLSRSTLDTRKTGFGGPSGAITLESRGAGDISLTDTLLNSAGRFQSPDNAGAIRVSTLGKVKLDNSQLLARGSGAASGPIEILGSEISIRRGSAVTASQLDIGEFGGQIRPITMVAAKSIWIDQSSVVEARELNNANPRGALTTPGEIRLTTPKLMLDGTISTESISSKQAGSIIVQAPFAADGTRMDLSIRSNTGNGVMNAGISNPAPSCVGCGSGAAGLVQIDAGRLSLTGVSLRSEAGANTTGTAGSIVINARGAASIDQAHISADSSGQGRAGSLAMTVGDSLKLRDSIVAADSHMSDSGSISVSSGRKISLVNSLLSASVKGVAGNAGHIAVDAPTLVLKTGFIQANTIAAGGIGGDIAIMTNALVPIGSLSIGGTNPVEFESGLGISVVQSAAPNGTPGTISIGTP